MKGDKKFETELKIEIMIETETETEKNRLTLKEPESVVRDTATDATPEVQTETQTQRLCV